MGAAIAGIALSACQPGPDPAQPATPSTDTAPTSSQGDESDSLVLDSGRLIGADEREIIAGAWAPYSRMAETEFGELTIEADRINLSVIGSIPVAFTGNHALLMSPNGRDGLTGVCAAGSPAAIEFRLKDKADYLAPETSGQVLELSFYSSAENLASDRDTNLDLCRTTTWHRD